MPFQPIRRILSASMRDSGIEARVSAMRVIDAAKASLTRLWGCERASFVEPVAFSNGILKVDVRSSSAEVALNGVLTPWVNETNRALGAKRVTEVRVRRADI